MKRSSSWLGRGTYYEPSIAIDARSLASLSITGAGASATTVRPGLAGAFVITSGVVTLSGLSINGSRQSAISVRTDSGSPGADVNLTDDSFSGDEGVNGGAVEGDSSSYISVTGDTFAGDESSFGDGGALFSQGAVVATDDTFSSDSAGLYGGAVFAGGALVAADDTFIDDAAASGGAITTDTPAQSSPPPVSLANDTFFGDMAMAYLGDLGSGGAVTNLGSIVSATQDTFSADIAASGRGAILHNEGSVILSSSILDEPEGIPSCDGAVEDGGYNVETDDSCGLGPTDNPPSLIDQTDINLSTEPSPNGSSGPETLAIAPSSSAFGEVPASACTVTSDERGWPRPGAGAGSCDAGAFEYLQLSIEVSGHEPYLSSSASFSFSDNAPAGLRIEGTPTCSTVNDGTPLSALSIGNYTVDGPSCNGLNLAGTGAESTGIAYTGVPDGFVVGPSTQVNEEKLASNFVEVAESVVGDPYAWGQGRSKGATSFDCSGLVVYSLLNVGYSSVPLDTYSQFAWATPVSIEEAYTTPGALLFGQFGEAGIPGPGHVAISLGNGNIIEAAHTGTNVSIVAASLTAPGILTTSQPDVGDLFTQAGLVPGLDYNFGTDGNLATGDDNNVGAQ